LVARYPYGFVKSIGYVVPLTSAFAGYGAIGAGSRVPERFRQPMAIAAAVVVGLVVLASANATRDMLRLWVSSPPALASTDLRISDISADVPAGASVLIDDPTIDYGTLVKAAAIAYFLPDRNVRVYVGETRLGTFPKQNIHPQPCGFDYVIRALRPERDYAPVYTDPVTGLSVFRRLGSPCPGG
jgi:hypothetical protein